jgi:uncharacterized membrane protein
MAESLQPAAAPSSTGLAPNVAAALSYVFAPIGGIVFYFVEKENAFVRSHAVQSIGLGAALIGAGIVMNIVLAILGFIPVIGVIAALLAIPVWLVLCVGGFILWLMAVMKAYAGTEYEIPVIGAQARRLLQSGGAQA